MKTQLLFDLESTGLLRRGSTIHCMVMRDAVDSSTHVFDHQPERALIQGIKQLEDADVIIGHNADRMERNIEPIHWTNRPP